MEIDLEGTAEFSTGKKIMINDVIKFYPEIFKEILTIQEGIEFADYQIDAWGEFKKVNS
jgi:hypothetical protein